MRPALALLGLPGVGKTRAALAVADALSARGEPTFVLHTDLLKVTVRTLSPGALAGPIWRGDLEGKLATLAPLLAAQIHKAARDGYALIIEGTLALAADAPAIVLHAPDEVRAARIRAKHPAAAEALLSADLARYEARLAALGAPRVARVDASGPLPGVVAEILALWDTHADP